MKRQKIKRYRFSVTQNTRRRRAARPLKAVGVVLVCLCLLTGAAFGVYNAIQSKTTGWHGEGLHRYYISPTTGTRAQGLYEINYKLYYFGSNNFLKTGWIEENGYVGYANADGELTQGEAKIDGKYYYFQPETGQLYTGWIMLDGVQYCFDETGHPRTGTYQEDGKVWELDSDGRVKNRLNGWKKTDGVLKYYNNSGAPAQGWTEIDGKDYFFVDGVSQAGWVETDAGTRYLDGNGNQMTGWCVIDGQPYAFGTNGEPNAALAGPMLASARPAAPKSYYTPNPLFKIHNFRFDSARKISAENFVFCPRLWYNLFNKQITSKQESQERVLWHIIFPSRPVPLVNICWSPATPPRSASLRLSA